MCACIVGAHEGLVPASLSAMFKVKMFLLCDSQNSFQILCQEEQHLAASEQLQNYYLLYRYMRIKLSLTTPFAALPSMLQLQTSAGKLVLISILSAGSEFCNDLS